MPFDVESLVDPERMFRPRSRNRRGDPNGISPEDQQSLLGYLGGQALSGLEAVGNLLDIPGSMARDVLTGQNPLDQLLSPLQSSNRATGRDILTKWAGVSKNDPNRWELADFAGFGAELATDPLAFFAPFKLSKAGQLARKSGVLDDVAEVATRKAGADVGRLRGGMTTTLRDILNDENLVRGNAKAREAVESIGGSVAGKPSTYAHASQNKLATLEKMAGGADELNRLLDVPLRGLVGVPFGDAVGASSTLGRNIAGKLDNLLLGIRDSAPGRAWNAMFERSVKDTYGKKIQNAARMLTKAQDTVRPENAAKAYRAVELFGDLASEGVNGDDMEKVLTRVVELGRGQPVGPETLMSSELFNRMTPVQQQKFATGVNYMIENVNDIYRQHAEIGLRTPELEDIMAEYFPRYRHDRWKDTSTFKPIDTAWEATMARKDMFRNVPEGRSAIERMASDPSLLGNNKLPIDRAAQRIKDVYGIKDGGQAYTLARYWGSQAAENLGKPYYKSTIESFTQYLIRGGESAEAGKAVQHFLAQNAQLTDAALGRMMPQQPDIKAIAGPASNLADTVDHIPKGPSTPGAKTSALQRYFSPSPAAAKEPSELVPILDVLQRAGFTETAKNFTTEIPLGNAAGGLVPMGATTTMAGRLPATGQVTQAAREQVAKLLESFGWKGSTAESVSNFGIPRHLADDLERMLKGFTTPSALEPVKYAMDQFNSIFKNLNYTAWLPSHVRDRMSGTYQNFIIGALDKDVEQSVDLMLRHGTTVKGAAEWPVVKQLLAARGLPETDESATRILKELAFKHELIGRYKTQAGSAVASSGDLLADLAHAIPGQKPLSPGKSATRFVADTVMSGVPRSLDQANPINVRGFGGRNETVFAPVRAGEDLGYYTQSANVLGGFFGLLKKGWTDAAAAGKTKAAHGDYSTRAYSGFENNVMKKFVPFYSFSRKQIPFTIRELAENPGGRLAQTIRASRLARGQDATTPEHVASGASIPLGTLPDGSKRFINGLGLMVEDPLSFAGPDLRSIGLEALSRLTPPVKALLEFATGESFFQKGTAGEGGRALEDLDPLLGRIAANVTQRDEPYKIPGGELIELAAANMPGSRALTTLRQVTDSRKWNLGGLSNLLTGVKVTDVSPAAQDAILRQRAAALMKELGARDFAKVYFPEGAEERMSPVQQLQASQLEALNKLIDERRKERKNAKKP